MAKCSVLIDDGLADASPVLGRMRLDGLTETVVPFAERVVLLWRRGAPSPNMSIDALIDVLKVWRISSPVPRLGAPRSYFACQLGEARLPATSQGLPPRHAKQINLTRIRCVYVSTGSTFARSIPYAWQPAHPRDSLLQAAHFLEADLQPWAAALAAALFAPDTAQNSPSAARRPGRRARGAPRRSAPERRSTRLASRGVRAAPPRRANAAAAAVVSSAARGERAWRCLEELRPLDGAVEAVLRASELPLFEQLPRTPAEWQPEAIGGRAVAGALELSYREAVACCDAMHAVRNVHTLTLHSKGASSAVTQVGEPLACAAVAALSTLRTLKLCQGTGGYAAENDKVPLTLLPALTRLSQLAELELHCPNAELVTLAPPLGLLTTLTRLDVSESRQCRIGGKGALAESLAHLTKLIDLKLCAGVSRGLTAILATLTALTSLELHGFLGFGDDAEALAAALQRLSRLVLLNLQDISLGVGAGGAAALAPALGTLTALTLLELSKNAVRTDGAEALAPALHHLPQLAAFGLADNDIGEDGAAALAPALGHLTALTRLNLSENELEAEGAVALAPALSRLSRLADLRLASNEIGPNGAAAIASPIALLTSLTLLDLTNNGIGEEDTGGAEALAPALSRLSRLADLSLGQNGFDAPDVAALAPVLDTLTALTRLVFGGNTVGVAGAVALASCLRHLTLLADLRLEHLRCGDGGAAALVQVLHHLTALQQLHLGGNGIGNAGAEVLAHALSRLPRLAELSLRDNHIGDAGWLQLLTALPPLSPLHTFDLSSNGITPFAKEAVALSRLSALTRLRL